MSHVFKVKFIQCTQSDGIPLMLEEDPVDYL